MTDTITEPQAPPEESTPAPAPPAADTVAEGKQVEHTAGGFPVVPLSLSGTNTAASLFATAALAGGPLAAAVAMTGAAVLGVAAAHQRTTRAKKTPNGKSSPAVGRTPSGSGGRGLLGRIPSQPRGSSRSGGRGGTGSRPTSGGQAQHRTAGGAAGLRSSTGRKAGKPSVRQQAAHAAGGLAGGRAGQVQALRQQAKTQTPTRADARTAAVQARRQVADSRRAAKAATRNPAPAKPRTGSDTGPRRGGGADGGAGSGKARGPAARTLAKAMGKATAVRDRAVAAGRSARDRSTGRVVAAGKQGIREAAHRKRIAQLKAPAQKAAGKALLRSAVRFQARRAAAAVLGGLLGALGMVTTPLGRKLRWAWLLNPGRRLYRFLLGRARAERADRDADIRNALDDDERAAAEQADAERDQDTHGEAVGDQAARPTTHVPAPPTRQGAAVSNVSGFRFEELAAEMEQAAQSYEPESAMEILAMVEGLPEALTSIANVMRILAERSDSEFPLEKPIADGFSDIYGALTAATDVAEDLVPAFRMVHEADIARHEDPRNGPDAEKGWNV